MSALALAADAASAPDWVARWLAIAGLVVSIVTVVVTVSLWRRDGWKLDVVMVPAANRENDPEAGWANLYGPPQQPGDRPVLEVLRTEDDVVAKAKLINVGRMPCVVGDLSLWTRRALPRTTLFDDLFIHGRGHRMWSEVGLDRGSLPLTLAPTEAVTVTLTASTQLAPEPAWFRVTAAVGGRLFSSFWAV
jgi:hypothetical protein